MQPAHKPGTYALVLRSQENQSLQIGRLGKLDLQNGFYLYVGSAFGPGGVQRRISRHKKVHKPTHWHIDCLRKITEIREVWFSYDPNRREHQWADILRGIRGVSMPLSGFGSSDCKCLTHLFYVKRRPSVSLFRKKIRNRFEDHITIYKTVLNTMDQFRRK